MDLNGATTPSEMRLEKFPNYRDAGQLEVIDALTVDADSFMRRFSRGNRPCLVKNAVVHWPAYRAWRQRGYLRRNSDNRPVMVRSSLVSEVVGWSGPRIRDRLRAETRSAYSEMPFHDFLQAAETSDAPLVADSCRFSAEGPLERMRADVGGIPFMPALPRSRRYPPHRVFFYRRSYTDWHLHSTDETFMSQVIGTKEVLLLPPDETTWRQLRPIIEKQGYLWDIDARDFPETGALRPYRVVVEPGDAVYIPVFWWHAVESVDDQFGVTVAATFSSPLHVNGDMRNPIARRLAKTHMLSRHAPLVIGMIAYSAGYRALNRRRASVE